MKTIVSVTPLPISADSRTYKMAASFSRFGYKSIVVEGLTSPFHSNSLPFELICVKGGVIFTKADGANNNVEPKRSVIAWLRYWLLRLVKPFLNQIRTFLSLPDASLYYLHSFYQFPAIFLKSRLLGAPYIYDAHDYYQVVNPGKFNIWLEGLCIKSAKSVVTVSKGVAHLINSGYGYSPIVVRNCHDKRLERKPQQDIRQFLDLTEESFLLVVVGQAKDGMAVVETLEALRDLPSHVHLAFVGKNTSDYSKFVEQLQLESRVHLVPPVLPDQVVPFIASADAAMIIYYSRSPNYENCLPNGFFQSVSAKLPLIYSSLPEINLIADQYKIGIPINPQSPNATREGILHLLQSQDSIEMYRKNLEIARGELSWEREEQILQDLVEDVFQPSSRKLQ